MADLKKAFAAVKYGIRAAECAGNGKKLGRSAFVMMHTDDLDDILELLEAQEPRVLQIKEMALLEIAVFIETNGDLEGKGTDLFLAIPYIYAVSQNMLDGYIAFVDGNIDVYDLQAIDYGKCWRCWTSRPSDEQRKAVKWE